MGTAHSSPQVGPDHETPEELKHTILDILDKCEILYQDIDLFVTMANTIAVWLIMSIALCSLMCRYSKEVQGVIRNTLLILHFCYTIKVLLWLWVVYDDDVAPKNYTTTMLMYITSGIS